MALSHCHDDDGGIVEQLDGSASGGCTKTSKTLLWAAHACKFVTLHTSQDSNRGNASATNRHVYPRARAFRLGRTHAAHEWWSAKVGLDISKVWSVLLTCHATIIRMHGIHT
jgi:hypothetical protein